MLDSRAPAGSRAASKKYWPGKLVSDAASAKPLLRDAKRRTRSSQLCVPCGSLGTDSRCCVCCRALAADYDPRHALVSISGGHRCDADRMRRRRAAPFDRLLHLEQNHQCPLRKGREGRNVFENLHPLPKIGPYILGEHAGRRTQQNRGLYYEGGKGVDCEQVRDVVRSKLSRNDALCLSLTEEEPPPDTCAFGRDKYRARDLDVSSSRDNAGVEGGGPRRAHRFTT